MARFEVSPGHFLSPARSLQRASLPKASRVHDMTFLRGLWQARRNTLTRRMDGRPRGPGLRREFNATEMRAGREKFDAESCPFVRHIAEVDDPAFLLFFGAGVDQ